MQDTFRKSIAKQEDTFRKSIAKQEGVIYKIYSDDVDEIYIGSTLDYEKRKIHHKRCCYNKRSIKYNYKLYKFIRSHGGFYKFKFSILEVVKLQNKEQLRIVEQDHILRNENAVLNTNNAYTDVKEYKKKYFQDHKTEHKLYMRTWRKRRRNDITGRLKDIKIQKLN